MAEGSDGAASLVFNVLEAFYTKVLTRCWILILSIFISVSIIPVFNKVSTQLHGNQKHIVYHRACGALTDCNLTAFELRSCSNIKMVMTDKGLEQ